MYYRCNNVRHFTLNLSLFMFVYFEYMIIDNKFTVMRVRAKVDLTFYLFVCIQLSLNMVDTLLFCSFALIMDIVLL